MLHHLNSNPKQVVVEQIEKMNETINEIKKPLFESVMINKDLIMDKLK